MEKDIEYRIKRFLDECEDGNWYWDDGVDAIENLIKGYREKEADLYAANKTIDDQLSIINDLEADLMSVYMKGIVDSNELWRQSIHKKLDVYKDSCNVVDTLIADVLRDLLEEKFNGATKNN